ncbi:unnamed protein product [Caenorhabditis sp. 36 PRJEB53466]|nr:unnamed protein product [Caenorhabditis sp. 36 PRJEB53466]
MSKRWQNRRQKFTAAYFELAESMEVEPESPKKLRNEKEKEVKEENRQFQGKFDCEMNRNSFSRFYRTNFPVKDEDLEELQDIQRELKKYEHKDAVDFMAISWSWMNKEAPSESLPRHKKSFRDIPTYSTEQGHRALYRVIAEKEDAYILMACHVNVHGEHRGDLRFVEVNDFTVARGFHESVIGNLFLGDIVYVTELAKSNKLNVPFNPPNVSSVNAEEDCFWTVRSMTLLTRNRSQSVQFAVMENGKAVAKGVGEALSVDVRGNCSVKENQVYIGDMFVPVKVSCNFTANHNPSMNALLISAASNISPFPQSAGTIYQFVPSDRLTRMFEIGTDAFKKPTSESADTLEFCALIGYSAANTVFSAHDDSRPFPMINPSRNGLLVKFSIANPESQPTEGFWHSNGRIRIKGEKKSVNATIETILCENGHLKIVARLSRDAPDDFNFQSGVHTVQQRAPMEGTLIQDGFYKTIDADTNGKKIINTLYGGPPIKSQCSISKRQFFFPSVPPINLNEYQCEYVSRMLIESPILLGNSPFGCGKSMTIVTAALYLFEENKRDPGKKGPQLLITQSNYASVNLIDIALKTLERVRDVKFLRYVSENNWKEFPDQCRTEMDMPKLMNDVFVEWATETGPTSKFPNLQRSDMVQIVQYVVHALGTPSSRLNSKALSVLSDVRRTKRVFPRQLIGVFFAVYRPDIIVVTANSLRGLSALISLSTVRTVQIDEASQLPEYTLLGLLTLLPRACFGLIGDIQQLPPYCEEELTGKLKDYGVGNAMERAVKQEMFPQVVLRCVYRCHPATTQLLGELFYNNELVSGVTEDQRNEFATNRPHFWPNRNFPIMVVDNKAKGQAMGTSFANPTERIIVQQIVEFITDTGRKNKVVKPSDIGVISYYSAQTSMLTEVLREKGVKCGTVDSFQGSEREIIILCCTNDDIQEFMQLKNRLNVALSRSKQVTILIGNVEMLKKVKYWSDVVERAQQNGCVVDTSKHPFKVDPSGHSKKTSYRSESVNKLANEFQKMVTVSTASKKKS